MSAPRKKNPKPKAAENAADGDADGAPDNSAEVDEAGDEEAEGAASEDASAGEVISEDVSAGEAADPAHSPFVAPTAEELSPLFPNLEIHEVIAAGGMGAVYRVRQPQLDRFVALKILPPESGQESEYVERFGREAKLMAQLNHPNIVGIYDFGNAGDLFYFIMEFVDGQTLHEAIQAAPIPPNAARLLMLQISKGLKYAHDKGVLHLDIKPGNLMVNADGVVKILDFGLANLVGQDDEEAFGTPFYTAPERYTEGQPFDHRADIFSLGAVFYEMLTQSPPQGEYKAASQIAFSPTAYDSIINRCLQPDPKSRYPDAAAVGVDLAKAKNARAPAQLLKNTSAVAVSSTGAGANYQRAMVESQKKKAVVGWVMGGVGGIVAIGTLIYFLTRSDPEPTPGGGTNPGGGGVVVNPPNPPDPPFPPDPPDPPTGGTPAIVDRSPKAENRFKAGGYTDVSDAPRVAGRTVKVDALIETGPTDGVIVQHGGDEVGYGLYFQDGFLHFAVRKSADDLTTLKAPDTLSDQIVSVGALLEPSGAMSLMVNGKTVAQGSSGAPLPEQPEVGLWVGKSGLRPVGDFPGEWAYDGFIKEIVIETAPPTGGGGGGPFDGPFDG